jgi:tRNA A-37 threonylcarbamoyl transferase component Bud32
MTGEVIAGRYELEELVGSGGMSTVYRAHDGLLERKVALKILHQRLVDDEEYVERFRREARAVAQLAHPNIVTVIDRGEDGGRQFIVFEYVDGDDLKQVIDKTGPLPIDQVVELGRGIAAALAFAHERGIVHRDVKPQNVLLSDGRAKVTDFGIARSLDVEHGVTQTGTVLGTSNYIAPEQASGQPVDDRSDVYSFGVVLFELLTGTVPFEGESFVAVAFQHINEPAPSVLERRPDTPPRLARLVDAMLEKDHGARPSMDEVAGELGAVDALDAGGRTEVVPRRRAPHRRRRRSKWPFVLATLGVLVLAGAAAGLLLPDGEKGSAAGAQPVRVEAVGTVDPKGDGEHDAEVPNATDGNGGTYWTTSRYSFPDGGFGKEGVGLRLEASRPPSVLVVESETPGFTAEVRSGDRVVVSARQAGTQTTFELPEDLDATDLTLWITNRGDNGAVRINEVRAR